MKEFNKEALTSSLLVLGFEYIEPIFLTLTLGKICDEQKELKEFKYVDNESSGIFSKLIEYKGNVESLKEGITLESDSKLFKNFMSVKQVLTINNEDLINYLSTFGFNDVLIHKQNLVGALNNYPYCNKELEILSKDQENSKIKVLKTK